MTVEEFRESLRADEPPQGLSAPMEALWWDARGESTGSSDCWDRAHRLVDSLETRDGMAVHAYLHRREGADWNADYWYRRAGRDYHRAKMEDEWAALVKGLLAQSG
jgi:hypothetical protein